MSRNQALFLFGVVLILGLLEIHLRMTVYETHAINCCVVDVKPNKAVNLHDNKILHREGILLDQLKCC